MRVAVVGLGVQGTKRARIAAGDVVATVDPENKAAQYRDIAEVPLDAYDAVLACVPDAAKLGLLTYLIGDGKHVLVEKPLADGGGKEIAALQALARQKGAVCYTAYNHRFEPHFLRMRDLVASGELGRIYRCRMFYGNGTARLVRESNWRDEGSGVLGDLGSHLLDTLLFWFGEAALEGLELVSADRFENAAPDHVVLGSTTASPRCELEMTLLMWRKHFTCDVLAEEGSAHISSLCKWGPATFIRRRRVLPSGRPPEERVTLVQDDPTWQAEYDYFKELIAAKAQTDLSRDILIDGLLERLGAACCAQGAGG